MGTRERHSGMLLAGIQVLAYPWTPAKACPGRLYREPAGMTMLVNDYGLKSLKANMMDSQKVNRRVMDQN
jgi:hypothetical protein